MSVATEADRHKTGSIEGPRDLLEKLETEAAQLGAAYRESGKQQAYLAFNCAVTAWQLCDWVWAALTDQQRRDVEAKAALLALPKATLQRLVSSECAELAMCRQIATAMKHADVRDNPDARVKLVVEAATDVLEDEKGNLSFEQGEGIFIWFEDKPALPAHVFMAAHAYWANFLHERGL